MPMHDWTRVEAGVYHHFHHAWTAEITKALNGGLLPKDYYALAEQIAGGYAPDVVTLQDDGDDDDAGENGGDDGGEGDNVGFSSGVAVATAAAVQTEPVPETRQQLRALAGHYAERAGGRPPARRTKHVAVRHVTGDRVVAVIEVVSPGNKNHLNAFRSFVRKAAELVQRGVHLVLLDPFPPGARDPNGVHDAVWRELTGDEGFYPPVGKPLTLASYQAGPTLRGFAETIAVGDPLPAMPLFLPKNVFLRLPLEATYQAAWAVVPERWQREIAPPAPAPAPTPVATPAQA